MEYNDLINELLDLLDKETNIRKIKELKKDLLNDTELLANLNTYKLAMTVKNKQKLYENPKYLEYLQCESNLNILLHEIKQQFKVLKANRKCANESH